MAKQGDQKLTLSADAVGFDEAARKVAKITQAQAGLREEIEELGETSAEAVKARKEITDDREYLSLKNLAGGFAKLTMAIIGAVKALRLIPAAGAAVAGILAIREELKREIAERLRLIEVMRIQSKVADELGSRQLEQKETLERIAGRRREGGFADPGVARRVQLAAQRAQEQFTQLGPENINLAFGTFGDIEGLSQRDLVDLAIIASFDELEVGPGRSLASLKRQAASLLPQFRASGRIERYARRETLQGQGLGRPEYYTAQPSERAQRVLAEGRGVGGAKGTFRERLGELLPADYAQRLPGETASLLDRAVALYELFGTAEEFEKAKVLPTSPTRGITALANLQKGLVEMGLADQPGYGSRMLEAVGLTKDFELMRIHEFEELKKALYQIEKEGKPGAGRAKPDETERAMKEGAEAMKEGARYLKNAAEELMAMPPVTNNNYQGARFIGRDAETQLRRTENGERRARYAERVAG